jgi:hypothetical protein
VLKIQQLIKFMAEDNLVDDVLISHTFSQNIDFIPTCMSI